MGSYAHENGFCRVEIPTGVLCNKNLSAHAVRLYCQIRWSYDFSGDCTYNDKAMTGQCNISVRDLIKSKQELLRFKLIKIYKKFGIDSYVPLD